MSIFIVVEYAIIFFLSGLFIRRLYIGYLFRRDRKRIIDFLQDSKQMFANAHSGARATRTIAAHTQLSKERVRYICTKEKNITETESDYWELVIRSFQYAGA